MSEELYQDWVTAARRADDLDQLRARAEAAEADLERIRTTLPGLRTFLRDLSRTSILPVRSRARMWSNTLATLLDIEADS